MRSFLVFLLFVGFLGGIPLFCAMVFLGAMVRSLDSFRFLQIVAFGTGCPSPVGWVSLHLILPVRHTARSSVKEWTRTNFEASKRVRQLFQEFCAGDFSQDLLQQSVYISQEKYCSIPSKQYDCALLHSTTPKETIVSPTREFFQHITVIFEENVASIPVVISVKKESFESTFAWPWTKYRNILRTKLQQVPRAELH